jgi:hypothetical protein
MFGRVIVKLQSGGKWDESLGGYYMPLSLPRAFLLVRELCRACVVSQVLDQPCDVMLHGSTKPGEPQSSSRSEGLVGCGRSLEELKLETRGRAAFWWVHDQVYREVGSYM